MIRQTKFITNWNEVPLVVDLAYVSRLLGISNKYARQLVVSGKIAGFKVGKYWRIKKETLKIYVEN